jgi:hypothetical protein
MMRTVNGLMLAVVLAFGVPAVVRHRGPVLRLLERFWCKLFHVERRLWIYATGVQPFWHCDKCNTRTP